MSEQLSTALALANKDFNLDIPQDQVTTVDEFHLLLTKVIAHLLDNDFERLLNGLYRIDVSEVKVQMALTLGKNSAEEIASLIIERELQKVATRQRYKP